MDFYVLALPRSRTVWLSHLLTDENTVCMHEYYSSHDKKSELFVEGKRVGSVDTNPLMARDYGDKPVVIIKNDPAGVVRSVCECFDKPKFVDNFEAFAGKFIDKYQQALLKIKPVNSIEIDCEDLSDPDVIRELCQFVGVKITDERIKLMINTNISTMNRDIESSLRHTASCEGIVYKELIDLFYAEPVVRCEQILDIAIAKGIFDTCWNEVTADGVDHYTPDVLGEYWIGLIADGDYVGCFRLHKITTTTWEFHLHVIPEHRKAYSVACVTPIKKWCLENLDGMEKINVTIPALYQNVVKFVENIGFQHEGVDRLSFTKGGQLHDQIKLGMTRAEIEGSL